MRILAMDTSSPVATVAIIEGDVLKAEYSINHQLTHSEKLMPMINDIMNVLKLNPTDLDLIAVSKGPGSFTGIRIGVATANTMAQALNIPVVGVDAIEAMAYGLFGYEGVIMPIMDAQRKRVYTGIYKFKNGKFETLKDVEVMGIEDFIELTEKYEKVALVGDGVEVFEEILREKSHIEIPPGSVRLARASNVGFLAKSLYSASSEDKIVRPMYLRKSQAEIQFEEREKANGGK